MRIEVAGIVALAWAGALLAPASATAGVDVTRDATGGVRIVSTADAVEQVTLARTNAGLLRVGDALTPPTSSDLSCTPDPEQPTALACEVAPGAAVTVLLGTGADVLDARAATDVALVASGGAGADTLRVGASGTTRLTDTTGIDVVDLAHADAQVRIRYDARRMRLVARCRDCTRAWAVELPGSPGRVLLGSGDDDVDLFTWRRSGRTAWVLGAGNDRYFGSHVRRAVVDAGAGHDTLISRVPADVLRGGHDNDKIVDFGGVGDVLLGGNGFDVLSSLDARRDTLDGQAGLDQCQNTSSTTHKGCDRSGIVRNIEVSQRTPITTQAYIFAVLGIS